MLNWSLQPAPANDMFTNAFAIGGYSGTTNGSNVGATLEDIYSCELHLHSLGDDFADIDNSVWFAWTAPVGGSAEFDTIGSDFNTVLAVFTTTNGLCDPNIAYIAENDDITNQRRADQQPGLFSGGRRHHLLYLRQRECGRWLSLRSGNYVLNWSLTSIPSGNGS